MMLKSLFENERKKDEMTIEIFKGQQKMIRLLMTNQKDIVELLKEQEQQINQLTNTIETWQQLVSQNQEDGAL